MSKKQCRACKIEKEKSQFIKNHIFKDGIDTLCQACNRQRVKVWRRKNPEKRKLQLAKEGRKEYTQNKHLRYSFGITLDEYKKKLVLQNNVCAICKQPETSLLAGKVKRLAVDHCHVTGKIRGLLCTNCNLALGGFKDSPTIMLEAIKYITGY